MDFAKHNTFLFISVILIFVGCKQAPTKVIEQNVDIFEKNIVLLDTRSDLEFTSFHIQGAQNLLTEDFLILKNPLAKVQNKKRILDPDLNQTIRRLALKGVKPDFKIYLIGDSKNSVNNKKWRWLLSYLEISDVSLFSMSEIKKIKNGRFADAEKQIPWILKSSVEYQNEFILKKAPTCFVGWDEKNCK